MNIKIKTQGDNSILKFETKTELKEIMVNVDMFHPDDETIALAFKRGDTSGFIELTAKEFDSIFQEVKSKLHLIKGVKLFRG